MVSLFIITFAPGCTTPPEQSPPPAQKLEAGPEKKKEIEWGLEVKGLKTRLFPVSEKYVLGQPLLFRLEMINVSNSAITYNDQQVSLNDSLRIVMPGGKEATYAEGGFQTIGSDRQIKPGEVKILFDNLDIQKQYCIPLSGVYALSFRPYKDPFNYLIIPASQELKINILPGVPFMADLVFEKISGLVPQRWSVTLHRGKGAAKSSSGRICMSYLKGYKGPDADISIVELYQAGKDSGPGSDFHAEKIREAEYLGRNEFGHIYLELSGNTLKYWPAVKAQIVNALGIEKSD